jgi:signal transduction histidine kinase
MVNMLSRLRLRLTLIYLLVGMLLVAILGGSTYSVLYYYFQNANDQALQAKLASVLDGIDVSLPGGVNSAEGLDKREREDDHELKSDEIYEGEQSTIFILPLDSSGELLFNPNPYELPMQPDMDAVAAAQQSGTLDYRDVTLPDGTSARLLTYALPDQAVIDVIQLGKSVSGQISILNQFLTSLLVIGALSIVILGLGSWWIAGRSLASHQHAWDNQQTFIANASHELRTPLTLIRASAEAGRRRVKMDKKLDGYLGDVIIETDHMCSLVEDLLLLSRLDAGQLKLDFTAVNLTDLIENIGRQFGRLAAGRSIQFDARTPALELVSDKTRLRQVLLIMLDNAFQHTPVGGSVSLSVEADAHQVHFKVKDSGEGIPPDSLPRVFDRFYQVDSARSGENRGSGLGLSIAKSITEALGGRIAIDSEPGSGTEVLVSLPLKPKKR